MTDEQNKLKGLNGIASAADFRAAAAASKSPPERVVLPKLGKAVLMRRPAPMWFIFRGRLPQSLAIRAFPQALGPGGAGAGSDSAGASALEELALLADWIIALLEEVLVEPRVSRDPGPDEITPEMLDAEDVNFIIRWAYGEVGSEARDDLAPFRPERPVAAARAGGPDVVLPAE